MNKIARLVKEYWDKKSQYFSWDPETLDTVVSTLTDEEVETIGSSGPEAKSFVMRKIFNRHNDLITGGTVLTEDGILCSEKACITELNIRVETLDDCNKHCIYHIEDIEKEILPGLSLESIADLTAAIIEYNQQHSASVGK